MRIRNAATVALLATTALGLTACAGMKQSIGLAKVVPDEFLTVASAPLAVPPVRVTAWR